MPRDPSPEREIFQITDDELSIDDFEDDWVPLNQKPSRMAMVCKKLSSMFKRTPVARYTDGL
jgi:hypothetical protein